jgi:phenylacetate-CoA ligase
MGAWIGGLFTYEAIHRVAQKGYALSIITPGINKAEVINSVRKLGPNFDQVIIGCYPPIMRDIIDQGVEEGIDWKKYNLGIVFSAEGFGEEFRDYIAQHGKLANIYTSSLNHYGTVDLGTMSHETPLSILSRRQAVNDKKLFVELFTEVSKQPTFTQFLPELFYFEAIDQQVICSSYSGLPLVRYDLKDHGGVITLDEVSQAYERAGKQLEQEITLAGIKNTVWNLPFVYVYERSDFSVTFSGAQIYPEEIRRTLLEPSLHKQVTGKLTMIAGYDRRARNYLEIHIELRRNVKPSRDLAKRLQKHIVSQLLKNNSEYNVLYGEYKSKLHPKIKLWEHEHALHFSGRGKQNWVKSK